MISFKHFWNLLIFLVLISSIKAVPIETTSVPTIATTQTDSNNTAQQDGAHTTSEPSQSTTTDQPSASQPTDQPSTSQPSTDQQSTDQQSTDQPTTNHPKRTQPTTDQTPAQRPTEASPNKPQPASSKSTTFQSAASETIHAQTPIKLVQQTNAHSQTTEMPAKKITQSDVLPETTEGLMRGHQSTSIQSHPNTKPNIIVATGDVLTAKTSHQSDTNLHSGNPLSHIIQHHPSGPVGQPQPDLIANPYDSYYSSSSQGNPSAGIVQHHPSDSVGMLQPVQKASSNDVSVPLGNPLSEIIQHHPSGLIGMPQPAAQKSTAIQDSPASFGAPLSDPIEHIKDSLANKVEQLMENVKNAPTETSLNAVAKADLPVGPKLVKSLGQILSHGSNKVYDDIGDDMYDDDYPAYGSKEKSHFGAENKFSGESKLDFWGGELNEYDDDTDEYDLMDDLNETSSSLTGEHEHEDDVNDFDDLDEDDSFIDDIWKSDDHDDDMDDFNNYNNLKEFEHEHEDDSEDFMAHKSPFGGKYDKERYLDAFHRPVRGKHSNDKIFTERLMSLLNIYKSNLGKRRQFVNKGGMRPSQLNNKALLRTYDTLLNLRTGHMGKHSSPVKHQTRKPVQGKGDRSKQIRKLQRIKRLMALAEKRQAQKAKKSKPNPKPHDPMMSISSLQNGIKDVYYHPAKNSKSHLTPSKDSKDVYYHPASNDVVKNIYHHSGMDKTAPKPNVPHLDVKTYSPVRFGPMFKGGDDEFEHESEDDNEWEMENEVEREEEDFLNSLFGLNLHQPSSRTPIQYGNSHIKQLYGTCPALPVKVADNKVTVTTADGCKIVITISGQTGNDDNGKHLGIHVAYNNHVIKD